MSTYRYHFILRPFLFFYKEDEHGYEYREKVRYPTGDFELESLTQKFISSDKFFQLVNKLMTKFTIIDSRFENDLFHIWTFPQNDMRERDLLEEIWFMKDPDSRGFPYGWISGDINESGTAKAFILEFFQLYELRNGKERLINIDLLSRF